MSSSGPLVTAIAVCYNHERFVRECLESIRQQTYQRLQLIVIDDCSSDRSVRIIRQWVSYTGVDCLLIPHTQNVGICRALNEGLRHAKGEYISVISTDDVWMLDKTERQVRLLENARENVGVVYSDALRMDEAGRTVSGMFIESHRKFPSMPHGNVFDVLMWGNFIPAMTTLTKKKCFEAVGWYDERLAYEDWDMWLRIAQRFQFVFSPSVSAKYRIVPTSLMRSLLADRRAELAASEVQIRVKVLAAIRSDPDRYRAMHSTVMAWAEELYRLKHPDRVRWLWGAMLQARSLQMVLHRKAPLMGVCCALRMPYRVFRLLDQLVGLVWRLLGPTGRR